MPVATPMANVSANTFVKNVPSGDKPDFLVLSHAPHDDEHDAQPDAQRR